MKLRIWMFVLLFCSYFLSSAQPVFAADPAESLASEIDTFMQAGADGYLVWQYSGYAPSTGKTYFENDKYSFFREGGTNSEKICQVLKEKGGTYNNRSVGIGVNIWSLGNYPEAEITDHLNWLKNECGTKTVRVFAKAGEVAGMQKVARASGAAGVQLIISIGDYSNGGGGVPKAATKEWYASGYKSVPEGGLVYQSFAQQLAGIGGVFAFELANEAHCAGDDSALPAYTAWGQAVGSILRGGAGLVGYGQMASQDTTRCDSTGPDSPSHFTKSNQAPSINITSAHYYTTSERASALLALEQAKAPPVSKPFYIGEASAGPPTDSLAGYDTSIYEDYNTTHDDFYVHPILGLDRAEDAVAGPYNANLKKIRDDLVNQGYQAYCATPGFRIELTQEGKDWMADYVEQNWPGAVFGGDENFYIRTRTSGPKGIGEYVRSWLMVDYRNVETPVFRDIMNKKFLMSSLEEYFGFKDVFLGENPETELTSSAINSLLSNQQRCEASVRILIRQEEMCNKLVNPDACALYTRPISETSFTIKTMLDEYKRLAGEAVTRLPDENIQGYQDKETVKAVCNELLTTDWDLSVRRGLLYTPLTIDRAYRLAFLITTIELKHPTYSSMFNLYIHPNEGPVGGPSAPEHAVLVNAFKIPDILTTTQEEAYDGPTQITSGNTPWSDSSKLTQSSLLTREMQARIEEEELAEKSELLNAAAWYDTHIQEETETISCLVGTSNRGIGPPECKDELAKAVIDIVNAQTSQRVSEENRIDPTCQDLIKEPATEILDAGSFGSVESITNPPPSLTYKPEFGAELLHRIFNVPDAGAGETGDLDASHQIVSKGESHPSFAETWKPPDDPLNGDNPLGMPRDWGLKSLFHVTDQTYHQFRYTDCCDEREVRHYLVYPMGYDIETVQEVLASTFFNSEQKDGLAALSEEFDRIQLSGDKIEFTGGTREFTFDDSVKGEPVGYKQNWPPGVDFIGKNDPIRSQVHDIDRCKEVYGPGSEIDYIDPTTLQPVYKQVHIGWELPCSRTFGWEILQKGEALSAGLVGGKLGFYLQNVQKSLNTRYSAVRAYLDQCKTTEQFLTGRCGEEVKPVAEANPVECTDASCSYVPQQPPPPGGSPPSGACDDPTKDSLVVTFRIQGNREWKINITCPSCTGTWGDIGADVFVPNVGSFYFGRNNLPVGGNLEYPNNGHPNYGSTIPAGVTGEICANVVISSNSAGNQCGGTIHAIPCATVP